MGTLRTSDKPRGYGNPAGSLDEPLKSIGLTDYDVSYGMFSRGNPIGVDCLPKVAWHNPCATGDNPAVPTGTLTLSDLFYVRATIVSNGGFTIDDGSNSPVEFRYSSEVTGYNDDNGSNQGAYEPCAHSQPLGADAGACCHLDGSCTITREGTCSAPSTFHLGETCSACAGADPPGDPDVNGVFYINLNGICFPLEPQDLPQSACGSGCLYPCGSSCNLNGNYNPPDCGHHDRVDPDESYVEEITYRTACVINVAIERGLLDLEPATALGRVVSLVHKNTGEDGNVELLGSYYVAAEGMSGGLAGGGVWQDVPTLLLAAAAFPEIMNCVPVQHLEEVLERCGVDAYFTDGNMRADASASGFTNIWDYLTHLGEKNILSQPSPEDRNPI